jgi:hypothetical protein
MHCFGWFFGWFFGFFSLIFFVIFLFFLLIFGCFFAVLGYFSLIFADFCWFSLMFAIFRWFFADFLVFFAEFFRWYICFFFVFFFTPGTEPNLAAKFTICGTPSPRATPVSGSGWVAVAPLDRGAQRGHFGGNFVAWRWLWRQWCGVCQSATATFSEMGVCRAEFWHCGDVSGTVGTAVAGAFKWY